MPVLLIAVLNDPNRLWDVLDAWEVLGIGDATIMDSTGLHRAQRLRDDLPLFPSVHDLLESAEDHHRTLWSVVDDAVDLEAIVAATERIVGPLDRPQTGLIIALPVLKVWGLRPPGPEREG
jgi:hypothetical protein